MKNPSIHLFNPRNMIIACTISQILNNYIISKPQISTIFMPQHFYNVSIILFNPRDMFISCIVSLNQDITYLQFTNIHSNSLSTQISGRDYICNIIVTLTMTLITIPKIETKLILCSTNISHIIYKKYDPLLYGINKQKMYSKQISAILSI